MSQLLTRNASLGGAVAAALAASACCIGPLVFALLGIGGAGFLVALEPYRPLLTVLTVGLLGVGWFVTYRKPAAQTVSTGSEGGEDCGCEQPGVNTLGKRMLWAATGVVALALVFPLLTPYFF